MSGDVEQDECSFCHKVKPVERTYFTPSKYIKPECPERLQLYNEGDYFVYTLSCADCGTPKRAT